MESKETYVRNVFAQQEHFGRENIEAWLTVQRIAEQPDEMWWQTYLEHDRIKMYAKYHELDFLEAFADPYEVLRTPPKRLAVLGAFLKQEGGEVYHLPERNICLVTYAGADTYRVAEWVDTDRYRAIEVHPVYTMEAIYLTWSLGGSKRYKARRFLCGALQRCVDYVKHSAEEAFYRNR